MAEIPSPRLFPQHQQMRAEWPRALLVFIIIVTIAVTAARFMLAGYERLLIGQKQDLEKEIHDLSNSIPADDLSRLITLDRQIENLKLLLSQHTYASNLLNEIKSSVLRETRYVAIKAELEKRSVTLFGIASNMNAVSLQAASIGQSPAIESVIVKNVAILPAGGAAFDFDVIFAPELIQ